MKLYPIDLFIHYRHVSDADNIYVWLAEDSSPTLGTLRAGIVL